jgi:NTE family protein
MNIPVRSKDLRDRWAQQSPGRPPFERIALLLQGGGALGAYQGGVYQALAEAELHPDWVAGISIGAINAALIAGNPPESRVEKLRAFWETITSNPLGFWAPQPPIELVGEPARQWATHWFATTAVLYGAPGLYGPRMLHPLLQPAGTPDATSFYDTSSLKTTLERLVDFDRINARGMRFSVGAVNVGTGNFVYFDNSTHEIRPEHIMASGALPPGFPAVEIEGEHYWDGGLVSNTPLQWVLESADRQDTLAFQVDLWNARGAVPRTLGEVATRQKEIQFSSRTRASSDRFRKEQTLRNALANLFSQIPNQLRDTPEFELLNPEAERKVYNIVQLIYRSKSHECESKDFEFSARSMDEHWTAGLNDTVRTLRHPEVLQRPCSADGVSTFDLAVHGRM